MKKLICILMMLSLLMLVIPTSVFSASYVGLGFSFLNVDYADKRVGMFDDIRPYGKLVRLGTYLKPTLAVEARYIDAWAEESASDSAGKTEFDFHIITGLVKADLFNIKEAQVYALLGWSDVHLKAAGVSDSYNGITYGCGLEAPFTKVGTFSYSMEYIHIINEELLDVHGFTLMFNIRFGKLLHLILKNSQGVVGDS